jgi:hypothetical protein
MPAGPDPSSWLAIGIRGIVGIEQFCTNNDNIPRITNTLGGDQRADKCNWRKLLPYLRDHLVNVGYQEAK